MAGELGRRAQTGFASLLARRPTEGQEGNRSLKKAGSSWTLALLDPLPCGPRWLVQAGAAGRLDAAAGSQQRQRLLGWHQPAACPGGLANGRAGSGQVGPSQPAVRTHEAHSACMLPPASVEHEVCQVLLPAPAPYLGTDC